jgi:hypothetical protein
MLQNLTLRALLGCWLSCWLAIGTAAAAADLPAPFKATYKVSYRGFGAGKLTLALEQGATPDKYTYEMSVDPSFFARMAVNKAAMERSELEIGPDGVRPLSWRLDDGTSATEDDGSIDFDWQAGRATGTYHDKPVAAAITPNLQDRLSVQVAVMTTLLRDKKPTTITMMDGTKSKPYTYQFVSNGSTKTPYGTFDTVLYESTRPGSNRVSRVWYAPSLGFAAVRAEQVRNGKVETVMVLSDFAKL